MSHVVKLSYFKMSGKWYSDGEYESEKEELHDIWDEVQGKLAATCLPGLCPNHSRYFVLVNVPGHKHDHPRIINPWVLS